MSGINNSKIIVQLDLKIQHQVIEQHVAASPYVVGVELAEEINRHVHQYKLGYYPALDYFKSQNFIDPDLIGTAESIAWLIENLSLDSLKTWLRPEFSELFFETLKAQLFILPNIRPSQSNILHLLTSHFTPDHIKTTFIARLIKHTENEHDLIEKAKQSLQKSLKGKFSYMEITSINLFQN
ncbi:MAG: hypothetical protein OEY89_07555 [Gammaproteobacteria bacterium]|nr:hypothetical protein [Gammaproteobacteria bacterium]